MEREVQLFSIRSEIERLNNLKQLLEKQEDLKKSIKGLKSRQRTSRKSNLKERSTDRGLIESKPTEEKRKTFKSHSEYKPTLSAWLKDVVADSTIASAVSTEDMEDWTSHHYKNENSDNMKSCMKRSSKHQTQKGDRRVLSEEKQSRAIYDEPFHYSVSERVEAGKPAKYPSTPYRPRPRVKKHLNESVFVTEKGVTKKNVQTETLDTVGVQTSDSVQQLPVVHPTWFRQKHKISPQKCQSTPKCCSGKENSCQEEKKKAAVGYYITFKPSPREPDKPNVEQQPLAEVQIPVPMSEPKQKPSRRMRAGLDRRESERVTTGSDLDERERVRMETGTETESSLSDKDRQLLLQGAVGELQYYLLRNRPLYVSRAEDRRRCITQMQYLRELRDHSKRRLLSLTEPPTLAPPPSEGVKRVFSQQTMRRQTERKYRQLSEVRGKQQDTKRKESYRTNRLMAEIFKKKLQKRVLKGEVNLSNSVSVISSL